MRSFEGPLMLPMRTTWEKNDGTKCRRQWYHSSASWRFGGCAGASYGRAVATCGSIGPRMSDTPGVAPGPTQQRGGTPPWSEAHSLGRIRVSSGREGTVQIST